MTDRHRCDDWKRTKSAHQRHLEKRRPKTSMNKDHGPREDVGYGGARQRRPKSSRSSAGRLPAEAAEIARRVEAMAESMRTGGEIQWQPRVDVDQGPGAACSGAGS
jgi:hypothetical protein